MIPIFLHGGGDRPESRRRTFGRFVQVVAPHATAPLALVIAAASPADQQETLHAYRAIFLDLGLQDEQITPLMVSPTTPLTHRMLKDIHPSGLFVCGGSTPDYYQSLCSEQTWVGYLDDAQIPYGGTSAGAAVAAHTAIVGGWQVQRGQLHRPMLFQGASEGLDELTVKSGLGFVPFAVEVHASQWGTLLRLMHAVDVGIVAAGWALDEDTMLEINPGGMRVVGDGHAYFVQRSQANGLTVSVHVGEL